MVLNNYLRKRGTEYNTIVTSQFGGDASGANNIVIGGSRRRSPSRAAGDAVVNELFGMMDSDGDGFVSRQDFENYLSMSNAQQGQAVFGTSGGSSGGTGGGTGGGSGNFLGKTVGGYFSNKNSVKYRNSYQNLDPSKANQRLYTRINSRYLNIPSEIGEIKNNLQGDYYYSSIESADGSKVSMPLEREDFEGTDDEYLDYKLKELEWMLLQTQAVTNNLNTYANYITGVLSDRIKINKELSVQNSGLLNNMGIQNNSLSNNTRTPKKLFEFDSNTILMLLIGFLLIAILLKQYNAI